jgi:photosystem II stability/assembly factor-like uncharacterized protein
MRQLVLALALSSIGATANAQWIALPIGITNELRGLSAVSPLVVWASGTRGTVVHTADGGRTWKVDTIPGASKLDLRSVEATSALVAHAVSIADSGRIYRTSDGGRSWTQQYMSLTKGSFFDAIRFWDARHGIAVSDPVDGKFLLVSTSDGGDTWRELPATGMPAALPGEGAFAASGSCLTVSGTSDVWFATGGATVARVFHSSDRGVNWTVADVPIRAGIASTGIFSVAFRDAQHGIAVGGDYTKPKLGGRNVAITGDGGRTWALMDSVASPAAFLSSVTYVPGSGGSSVVATGLNGTHASRDGGRTWVQMDSVAYNSVVFASPDAGFLVGPTGRVAKTP